MRQADQSVKANLVIATLGVLCLLMANGPALAQTTTTLTVSPITWNVVGLDSNAPMAGPYRFPVGARVCNTGSVTATNLKSQFSWDTSNSYIALRPGTSDHYAADGTDLAPGECTNVLNTVYHDFYYEVEVTREAAAWGQTRQYHITAWADNAAVASTPTPRELFVEKLISQSRNDVTDVQLSTTGEDGSFDSIPAGGAMTLRVGEDYWIKLVGSTATNGYEQIETFINFPNTIFQVLSVLATYTAESSSNMQSPYTTPYGDGCVWVNNPLSPNYRSCLGTGKAGGDITVTYKVKILTVPSTNPEPLTSLIYDFSGSSYHYNSDAGVSARYVYVEDPSTIPIVKSFAPDSIIPNGTSTMTIRITNPGVTTVSGVKVDHRLKPVACSRPLEVAVPAQAGSKLPAHAGSSHDSKSPCTLNVSSVSV